MTGDQRRAWHAKQRGVRSNDRQRYAHTRQCAYTLARRLARRRESAGRGAGHAPAGGGAAAASSSIRSLLPIRSVARAVACRCEVAR